MKVNKSKILLLFLMILIYFFPKNAYAYNSVNFENLAIEDGLSQSTVETIVQDKKGYIWLGTNEGLNRYNGKEIQVFKQNMSNSEGSILNNYITTLAVDEDYLWIGTYRGLSRMNLSDYSIKNYTLQENKNYNILSTYISKEGKVYVGTHSGIFVYDEKNDKFSEIKIENNKNIYVIKEDSQGNLWLGSEKGIRKLNPKTNKLSQVNINNIKTEDWGKIGDIAFENENIVWVGTDNNGLKKIDLSKNTVTSFMANEEDSTKLQSNTINKIFIDSKNNIWIGTTVGLSTYLGKDQFNTYNHKECNTTTLASNIIFDIFEDKSGLIWVGNFAGVGILDQNNIIETYKSTAEANSLSSNIVIGVYEDNKKMLWVGTKEKGLNIIDRKNEKIIHITKGNTEYDLSSDNINFITGKEDTIWVATNYGVNKIDKNTGKIEKYTEEDGLVNNKVKTIHIDDEDNVWIGTYKGINILNTKTNEIYNINEKLAEVGWEDPHIQHIYEDDEGIIWIGGYGGIGFVKYDRANDTIKLFETYNYNGEAKIIDSVRHIVKGEGDYFWIGTSSGLLKFNKEKETFTQYTTENGLPNNVIYQILTDEEGNLWMSTNRGISKFNIKNEKFTNLTSSDGLQGDEFNGNSAYKCSSGELVFGGLRGLNIFNPSQITVNNYCGNVEFDSFEVMGEENLNNDEKVFGYNDNSVKIKYFLADYKDSEKIQYYYKLEGLNNNWETSKSNAAVFFELQPGEYTLRVKAKNSAGVMSKENKITFTIKPPFWKSKSANIIYLCAITLAMYIGINRIKTMDILVEQRTKDLHKEMDRNKKLFEQVIDAERRKNNYFINLSHELRTPLNILNSIEQIVSNYCDTGKQITNSQLKNYMNMMKNNTNRLMNLINNILDTSKMENGKYIINKQKCDIVYVVEEAALSLRENAQSAGIELIVDTDIEEKIINCDKGDIEKCIINLVSNSIKFTPPGGQISVNIHDIKKGIKIIVEDTGIGIDEEYQNSIFDRFNQVVDEHSESKNGSGLGLTITKQIIDLHKGKITLESGKGKGCKFTIILPNLNI